MRKLLLAIVFFISLINAKVNATKYIKVEHDNINTYNTRYKVVGIHNDTLNVRIKPNSRSRRIAELPSYGRNIKLLQHSHNKKWKKITYENYGPQITGWVYGKYIAKQNYLKSDDLNYDEKKILFKKLYLNADKYKTKVPIKNQLKDILYGANYFCSVMLYKCTKKSKNNYSCLLKIEGYEKVEEEVISWVYDIKFDASKNSNGLDISRIKSVNLWD